MCTHMCLYVCGRTRVCMSMRACVCVNICVRLEVCCVRGCQDKAATGIVSTASLLAMAPLCPAHLPSLRFCTLCHGRTWCRRTSGRSSRAGCVAWLEWTRGKPVRWLWSRCLHWVVLRRLFMCPPPTEAPMTGCRESDHEICVCCGTQHRFGWVGRP